MDLKVSFIIAYWVLVLDNSGNKNESELKEINERQELS